MFCKWQRNNVQLKNRSNWIVYDLCIVYHHYNGVGVINKLFSVHFYIYLKRNEVIILKVQCPVKNYRGLSPNYREKRWAYVQLIRVYQSPHNLPAVHLLFTGIFPPSHYKQRFHIQPIVRVQGNSPPQNYKHANELRFIFEKLRVIVT